MPNASICFSAMSTFFERYHREAQSIPSTPKSVCQRVWGLLNEKLLVDRLVETKFTLNLREQPDS